MTYIIVLTIKQRTRDMSEERSDELEESIPGLSYICIICGGRRYLILIDCLIFLISFTYVHASESIIYINLTKVIDILNSRKTLK
jgi:hypothetical protein